MKKKNNKKPRDQIQAKQVKEGKELKKKYKGLIPLTKDICFKMFFGKDQKLLIGLLNTFLPPSKDRKIKKAETIKADILPETIGDKITVFDIYVKLNTGEKVIVEMQNKYSPEGFEKRFLYYFSRLLIESFKLGEKYETLKPAHILIFTTANISKYGNELYSVFSMRSNKKPYIQFSNIQNIIIVQLNRMKKDSVEKLVDLMEEICYLLIGSNRLTDKELKQLSERSSYMKRAVKTLKDLSQDEQARYAMEQRLKGLSDYRSDISYAKKEGLEKGMKKGRSEGMEKGIEKGMETVALNMLKANLDTDLISEVTGLSKKEIQKLSK